jgi:hypothetical protein
MGDVKRVRLTAVVYSDTQNVTNCKTVLLMGVLTSNIVMFKPSQNMLIEEYLIHRSVNSIHCNQETITER